MRFYNISYGVLIILCTLRFQHITKDSKINCFTQILHWLEFVQALAPETLLPNEASNFIDKRKHVESPNNLVNSKLLFLIDQ